MWRVQRHKSVGKNNMKKLLLTLLGVLLALPSIARDFTYEHEGQTLTYTVINEETKTCKTKEGSTSDFYGGNKVSGNLTIPTKAKDGDTEYTVTTIGTFAFYGCSGLTSVIIPSSITSIDSGAFRECSGLTSVVIPNAVTTINEGAFYGCNGLISVTIPSSVTSIGGWTFHGCDKLSSVKISDIISWCKIDFSGMYSNPLTFARNLYINDEEITDLEIPEAVKEIKKYAFYGCTGLASVKIPNSVSSIDDYAFYGCTSLTSMSIPNSITYIGDWAFAQCRSLTSVIIPNSVSSIGKRAFTRCGGLTSVTIPNSVSSIGDGCFADSYNIIDITVDENNPAYISDGGILFNKDKSKLVYFPARFKGEYAIPNSVTSIASAAFYHCDGLTSVIIPSSVTSISNETFAECYCLASVTIPNSVTSIGELAFYNCESLASVVIPNSVTTINEGAFCGCNGLTSMSIPSSVTSIGWGALEGCSSITSIVAEPTSPPTIQRGCFEDLYDKASLIIPDSSIGEYLATPWGEFLNIKGTSTNDNIKTYSDGVFTYRLIPNDPSSPDPVTRPNTAVIVKADNYTSLTNADIPERFTDNGTRYFIKGIGYDAFANCTQMTAVNFTNINRSSLQFIGHGAFRGCRSLTSMTIPNSVSTIGDESFQYCNITSINIPDSVTSIGNQAFANCRSLTSVAIPNSVTSIGEDAFYYCFGLTSVKISDIASWCNIDFHNKYSNPLSHAHRLYINDDIVNNLEIPETVKEIKKYAFHGCLDLHSVTIPNSVTYIDKYAFYNSSINEFTIADGNTPIRLYCSAIHNSIPETATILYIGRNWYYENESDIYPLSQNVTKLTIGNDVTEVNAAAFKDAASLKSVTFGSSITDIGENAFNGCTALTELNLGPSVIEIGAYAFAGCKLTDIKMGCNVTTIGEKAFDQSPSTSVAITAQLPPTAPDNTFSSYTGTLYVQDQTDDESVLYAYYDSDYCWYRFNSMKMIIATEIEQSNEPLKYEAGTTQQLTAKVMPENASLTDIYWVSTNPNIASVSPTGLVTYHTIADTDLKRKAQASVPDFKIIAKTLYADGPIAEFTVENTTTSIPSIGIDNNNNTINYSAPYEVYNLCGVCVAGTIDILVPGIYIIRQGRLVKKIMVK